jgi:hypothetical protein
MGYRLTHVRKQKHISNTGWEKIQMNGSFGDPIILKEVLVK